MYIIEWCKVWNVSENTTNVFLKLLTLIVDSTSENKYGYLTNTQYINFIDKRLLFAIWIAVRLVKVDLIGAIFVNFKNFLTSQFNFFEYVNSI